MAKSKITVLGDGGWGTALALLSYRTGHYTTLWGAFSDYIRKLQETRENTRFLKGVRLPEDLALSDNLRESISSGDIIIIAVPSLYLRNVLWKVKDIDLRGKLLVSVAKGLERKTLLRPSQIIESVLGQVNLVILSGPSHAEEVARELPSAVVAASRNDKLAQRIQEELSDKNFRIYTVTDIVGVELGGALKNVIALAAGICDGLKFGSNAKSALIARGLLEMTRLGIKMGANPNTFFGLSGLGDLVTTCISEYGRNRLVGMRLGQGEKLEEILGKMEMVAEGVETTRSVIDLARRYEVKMPIAEEIYKVLFEDKNARQAVEDLMLRDVKEEMRMSAY